MESMGSVVQLHNYSFHWSAVPMALTMGCALGLGVAVVLRERGSWISWLFLAVTGAISVWLFAFAWMYCAVEPSVALWWAKTAYCGVPFIAASLYHFTTAVLGLWPQRKRWVWINWAIAACFTGLILSTDMLIVGLYHYWWGHYPRYEWLSAPYLAWFVTLMAVAFHDHWTAYQQAAMGTIRRHRAKALAVAVGLLSLGCVDYAAKFGIPLYPFGYLPVLAFLALAARTIWRYQFVDITPAFAAPQIVDTMVNALIVLDHDGVVRIVNRAACALFEQPEEALLGKPFEMPSRPPLTPHLLNRLLCDGPIRDCETTLTLGRSIPRTLSLSASLMWDHAKKSIGTVCVFSDITERKHAEEERDRIFNLSLDLLCIADFNGFFKQLNPQWERVVGFSIEELLAKPYLEFVHPQDQAATQAEAARLATGTATATFENRYLCKDGTYKWLQWTAVPFAEQRLIYAAARDITERMQADHQLKRAHTDLKKSHEELQTAHLQLMQAAKMESIGRLAAGVAHEVKNPLAIILQGVDYLSKHLTNTNGNTRVVLQYTSDAVRRADSVIRGLLDFSTTRELVMAAERMPELIERALLLIKHELDRSHITMVKLFEERLPTVRVDRNKIEQVLVNVLMNAVQAMAGGGTLTVRISSRQLTEISVDVGTRTRDRFKIGDTVVVVDVEDTGTGIAEDILERVFDPFFTTKPAGSGTGLGLTVTRKIVDLHHGQLTIKNRPEGGVKVTLVLRSEPAGKEAPCARDASCLSMTR